MVYVASAIAAVAALAVAWFAGTRRVLSRRHVARAVVVSPEDHTTIDEQGAVRSVQAADLTLPVATLDEIWSPMHLERLARTYWRFLSRSTLGLVRVEYGEHERSIVLLARPLVLLRFHAPEYAMDATRGVVRWRIADGLLVSRAGHDAGYLQIEIRRCAQVDCETARAHVEVEVANFYPALAIAVARWFYSATQSQIHVIVTHGFLRSLAKLELPESIVGRYAAPDDAAAARELSAGKPRSG